MFVRSKNYIVALENVTMNSKLNGTEPILCTPIVRQVDQHLIELLSSLDSDEWDLPTVVPQPRTG
jgi:hypothetical protein